MFNAIFELKFSSSERQKKTNFNAPVYTVEQVEESKSGEH